MTDPCDNCKRPWCYDCPYQENEDETKRKQEVQQMTNIERVRQIADELMAYFPIIDISYEQFYQVAIALVDLGYVKREVLNNEN